MLRKKFIRSYEYSIELIKLHDIPVVELAKTNHYYCVE